MRATLLLIYADRLLILIYGIRTAYSNYKQFTETKGKTHTNTGSSSSSSFVRPAPPKPRNAKKDANIIASNAIAVKLNDTEKRYARTENLSGVYGRDSIAFEVQY